MEQINASCYGKVHRAIVIGYKAPGRVCDCERASAVYWNLLIANSKFACKASSVFLPDPLVLLGSLEVTTIPQTLTFVPLFILSSGCHSVPLYYYLTLRREESG